MVARGWLLLAFGGGVVMGAIAMSCLAMCGCRDCKEERAMAERVCEARPYDAETEALLDALARDPTAPRMAV